MNHNKLTELKSDLRNVIGDIFMNQIEKIGPEEEQILKDHLSKFYLRSLDIEIAFYEYKLSKQ